MRGVEGQVLKKVIHTFLFCDLSFAFNKIRDLMLTHAAKRRFMNRVLQRLLIIKYTKCFHKWREARFLRLYRHSSQEMATDLHFRLQLRAGWAALWGHAQALFLQKQALIVQHIRSGKARAEKRQAFEDARAAALESESSYAPPPPDLSNAATTGPVPVSGSRYEGSYGLSTEGLSPVKFSKRALEELFSPRPQSKQYKARKEFPVKPVGLGMPEVLRA